MSAAVADRAPTAAEREQSPLVAEVEHVRALLEAFRDGEPAPARPPRLRPASFEPAVDRLARLAGLSEFERQLVLLAAAVELDGDVAALTATLQGGGDPRPTFGLALAVLPGAHWDALAPSSPLRRRRLLELGTGSTLASRPLRLDERVLHYLTGIEVPDERLDGVVRAGVPAGPLAPSQERLAADAAAAVGAAGPRVLLRLDGDDADALLGVAQAVAAARGRVALVVRASALPPAGSELAQLARLVDREALARGSAAGPRRRRRLRAARRRRSWTSSRRRWSSSSASAPRVRSGRRCAPPCRRAACARRGARRCGRPRSAKAHAAATRRGDRTALPARARRRSTLSRASWPRPPTPTTTATRRCAGSAASAPASGSRVLPSASSRPSTWDDLVLPAGHLELLRRDRAPRPAPHAGLRALGLRRPHDARPRRHRALRRRERHRQDAGRRGARRRARASTSTASTSPPPSASTSARPRRTSAGCSTPPRRAAQCCSSTRPTRSSASAARSRTATTATPTSRSPTSCSGWSPTAASPS